MIIEHQTLEMWRLLSYRAKMTQQELNLKSQEIAKLLEQSGAKKTGGAVTGTFSVEQGPNGPLMDVEILIPLDRDIPVPAGYTWKPHFLLTNALLAKHHGNPATLQSTANELNAYMAEHQLVPITVGYNVTVKEAKTPAELDDMEVDIYVGVSPNIL